MSSTAAPMDPMESFLRLLSSPEDLALSRRRDEEEDDDEEEDPVDSTLRETCQLLFHRLTELTRHHHYHARGKQPENLISDVPSLVVVEGESTGAGGAPVFHGAETVWGQIDHLQHSGRLRSLVKKSLMRLGTADDAASTRESVRRIRLLDDGDESVDRSDQVSAATAKSHQEPEEESSDADAAMSERIRARMSRVMNDMEEEDDEDDATVGSDDNSFDSTTKDDEIGAGRPRVEKDDDEDDSLLDPAVRELNDGIFDFHEMEAFADEEEEYLPDSAFGVEKPDDVEEARSLHARLRDGDLPTADDDDDDDSGREMLATRTTSQRRRKYRDDEDVDALLKMYEAPPADDGDGDDSIVHMTALEMFGAPNPKYYKKRSGQTSVTRKANENSWGDEDIRQDTSQSDDRSGWNDKYPSSDDDARRSENELGADANGGSSVSLDRLALQAQALEQELVAEKPWQMRGEASSTSRPVNSLLVSRPEYEVAAKIAPAVTAENSELLEEVIKRRVLNEEWDDVIPRELPDVGWHLRRGELPEVSQEKSKLSLGELYERDYLKKAMGYDADASEKATELDKVKSEIKSLFGNLSSSLDALSNYHFAPRPVAEAADVRVLATPAIAMEEVLPLHVSDARASAPQEVHFSKRGREGVLVSEAELDTADRKKARSAKKAARRKARKEKLADEKIASRLVPNNPYDRRKVGMELQAARASGKVVEGQKDSNGNYGDSGTFFKRLQREAEQETKGKLSDAPGQKKTAVKVSHSFKM